MALALNIFLIILNFLRLRSINIIYFLKINK